MTAAKEAEELMNLLLRFVEHLLREQGGFHPIGAALGTDGEVVPVAAYEGEEQPPAQQVIDRLLELFRAGARAERYRATALAYDVQTTPPGASEPTDAILIQLDHVDGYSIEVAFPYRLGGDDALVIDEPFAGPGPGDVFGTVEQAH